MEISESDIKLISRLIAERLGTNAAADKIKMFVADVVECLTKVVPTESPEKTHGRIPIRKLIINAFGLNNDGLEENLRNYLNEKNLPLAAISISDIEKYQGLIAIIDYSEYPGDINRVKFEISEICENVGYKAIVQDSLYYGL
jgi:hypothetical protein